MRFREGLVMCRLRQFDKPITNISKSSQKGTLLRRGRPRFDKRVVSGFLPDKLWGRLLNSSSSGISRLPPADRSIGLQISPYLAWKRILCHDMHTVCSARSDLDDCHSDKYRVEIKEMQQDESSPFCPPACDCRHLRMYS